MADLRVPPVVGTYGPPGTGKTSDKIWAYPNALYFAGPGALSPAISIVGYEPPDVVILDPLTCSFTELKKIADAKIKASKGKISAVVIDDFSMVAHRTARLVAPKYRDGRQMYGAIRGEADEMFDIWRSWGLAVLVDCHEDPLEFHTDKEGQPTSRIKHIGMPDLPGQKSSPDMVKAFDMFYRVKRDQMRQDWPFVYAGGPFGMDADQWYTKDRWSVVGKSGMVPMNIGEILRSAGFSLPRPPEIERVVEPYVQAAVDAIMSGQSENTVLAQFAQHAIAGGHAMHLIRWFARDARARVELLRNKAQNAQLAAMGLGGGGIL